MVAISVRRAAAVAAFAFFAVSCSRTAQEAPPPDPAPSEAPPPAPLPAPEPPAPVPAPDPEPEQDMNAELFRQAVDRGLPGNGLLLVVDVDSQKATLLSARTALREYPVSTASAGTGAAAGSNRTPLGWHRVAERYGTDAPPGTMFVSRRPSGRVIPPEGWRAPDPAEDAVLTRVMWLEGLEPGVNKGPGVDSHERCIYLHGTNQEQKLGSPASHGCIRFSNKDVAELFRISTGAELYCLVR